MLRVNKIFIVVVLFLCFMVFTKTHAQESEILTLEKSVQLALERNPELKIAQKELEKADAAVGESYANILPQLDASVNFQHAWEIQENTMPNFIKTMLGPLATPDMPDYVQISFGLENTLTYGLQLTQPLFLGFAGIAGIQTAKAVQKATEQNLILKKQNLIYNTANSFYVCLLAKELVRVQEEALEQSRANLDVVFKKYEVGSASGFDKMRAEVEFANLQPEVITARNNYQSALTGLRNILGLDKNAEIQVEGKFYYSEDDFSAKPLSELQEMAIAHRPELKALNQQKVMMDNGITIARSSFLPKLFFSTDYSYLAQRNDLKFGQGDFNKGFTSAISLQIPLFSGLRSMRQYQKAKLDYKITLDTEKQLLDGMAAQVEVAYNKLMEAKEKYFSAKETVDLATEALRLANLMYNEGANMQLDVLNSQLALTRANLNFVSSLYEYQVARYEVRKVTGQLNDVL